MGSRRRAGDHGAPEFQKRLVALLFQDFRFAAGGHLHTPRARVCQRFGQGLHGLDFAVDEENLLQLVAVQRLDPVEQLVLVGILIFFPEVVTTFLDRGPAIDPSTIQQLDIPLGDELAPIEIAPPSN